MNIKFTVLEVLLLFSIAVHGKVTTSKKRICVIGAGPSGLASVKQLSDNLDEFEPIVFEKKSDVGGQWLYTDNVGPDEFGLPVQSSIYKNLRTNGPKELTVFPDNRNYTADKRSCVHHEKILTYLKNYAAYYNLRRFIRFNTLVERVTPVKPELDDSDWRKFKWRVAVRNSKERKSYEITCDAVMVCNGHNSKPFIPKIPGIEKFPGRVIHSHVYRRPEEFSGQTIVILGAGDSAIDLATEIRRHAKTVYLSHRHDKIPGDFPTNIIQVAGVVSANGNELTLKDGSKITADSFIFCTGYNQDMPFLRPEAGVEVHGKDVDYLYKHIVNINHPSMGFVGAVVSSALTFARFHLQAQYYLALLRGTAHLPTRSEMLKDALKLPYGKNYTEWDYYDDLVKIGDLKPLPRFYEEGLSRWLIIHENNILNFKEYNVRILDNGSVQIIPPSG